MVDLKESVCLAFKCPSCLKELYLPVSMGGVKGPCPSCGQAIEAPRLIEDPMAVSRPGVDRQQSVGGAPAPSDAGSPPPAEGVILPAKRGGAADQEGLSPGPILDVRARDEGREAFEFQARRRIDLTEEVLPDETWREKQQALHEEYHQRRKREALATKVRAMAIGLLAVALFCVVIGYIYYRDHLSRVGENIPLDGFQQAQSGEEER
jgi:hypothetical protein